MTAVGQTRLHLVAEFGQVEGPASLTTIGGAIPLGGGAIAVSQPRDPALVVLGPAGELTGRYERAGEGPGDLRQPYWLQRYGSGFAAVDPVLSRVSVFSAGLALDTVLQLSRTYAIDGVRAVIRGMTDASFIVVAGDPAPRDSRGPGHGTLAAVDFHSLETRTWDGVRLAGQVGELRNPRQPDGVTWFNYRYPTSDIVAVSPVGAGAVRVRRFPVEGGSAEIVRYGPDGVVAFRISLPSPRVEIPARELEEARASLVRAATRGLFSDRRAAEAEAERVIANTRIFPPALDAVVGEDGRVWILQASERHASGAWTVLSSEGTVLERNIPHPGGRLLYVSAEMALFDFVDDEGIPYLRKYELRVS